MPRVCIAGYFPPPITGQTLATERLAALLEDEFAVTRVPLNRERQEAVETAPGFRLSKVRGYIEGGGALRAALRATTPDVLLWPSISPQTIGHLRDLLTVAPALSRVRRRYGVVHWGNFQTLYASPLTRYSATWLSKRLDGLVFLNADLAGACAGWLPDTPRHVIPNTIDDALLFDEAAIAEKQRARRSRRSLRILFLSNMIASKGYLDVVEAADLLRRDGIPFELRMIGRWIDPEDRRAFEQRVAGDLAASITHLGAVSDRAAIRGHHAWADVFLFPTYYPTEAQPLVLLEAMSAGTPVVTTAHAGIPAMFAPEGEAVFVPPRAPRALAEAVRSLTDPDAWMARSRGVRARFESDFSPEAVRRRWRDLIASPSGGGRA
ncbi:MAG: glycosyltransferase family 4 protein [Rhodothermales bacterium]